jgi:MoaA/NifB/PqqE/SkfB family radical SAM enzyme
MSVTYLQIEPTTRCNFTCGFCCGRKMDQSDLNFDAFVNTLEQFPNLKHIEIQGEGEPLLHPQFFEMAKLAQEKGIKVSTITNGSMFTPQRIENILEVGISSILVSIESPDTEEFKQIRGGNLDKVITGIEALLIARNSLNQIYPAVGFAVTVLKQTRHHLAAIAHLYHRLGMDGGILVHLLSSMEPYAQVYQEQISSQLLSPIEQALVWSKYAKILGSDDYYESPIQHFWDDLLHKQKGKNSQTTQTSGFHSCPWLDQALFINRHGVATVCPNAKDTERFALGAIGRNEVKDIIQARNQIAQELNQGIIPDVCNKCFIAESIVKRKKNLG